METLITAQYCVVVIIHKIYFKVWSCILSICRLTKTTQTSHRGWLKVLFFCVVIYGTESFMGNYTQPDLLVGVAMGVLIGILQSYLVMIVLFPLQPYLQLAWWLWFVNSSVIVADARRWSSVNGYHSRYSKEREEAKTRPRINDVLSAFIEADSLTNETSDLYARSMPPDDWAGSP